MSHLLRRLRVPLIALALLSAAAASAAASAAAEPLTAPPTSEPQALRLLERVPLKAAPSIVVDPDRPGHGNVIWPRSPQGRIVGGSTVDIRTAPWQVFLLSETATTTSVCGGSIISPTTVITAAHCIDGLTIGAPFDQNGLGVIAGLTDVNVVRASDQPQFRQVVAARSHPSWKMKIERAPEGDVAVLTLASPLDLAPATARAIPLPSNQAASVDGEPVAVGPAVRVTGFGLQAANAPANGQLFALDASVVDPATCGAFPNASGLCVQSGAGTICSGDSGSGLVAGGQLVGVVSAGPVACAAGDAGVFTNLQAPENRLFVDGSASPPIAPIQTAAITGAATPPRAGGVLTCSGGGFTGAGASVKWVVTNDLGQRIGATVAPALSYAITAGDAGRTLSCRAYASNAGGVVTSETLVSPVIQAAPSPAPVKPISQGRPRISLDGPGKARRREQFRVRVRITNASTDSDQFAVSIARPTVSRRHGPADNRIYRHKTVDPGSTSRAVFVESLRIPSNAKIGKQYWIHVQGTIRFTDGTRLRHKIKVPVRVTR